MTHSGMRIGNVEVIVGWVAIGGWITLVVVGVMVFWKWLNNTNARLARGGMTMLFSIAIRFNTSGENAVHSS